MLQIIANFGFKQGLSSTATKEKFSINVIHFIFGFKVLFHHHNLHWTWTFYENIHCMLTEHFCGQESFCLLLLAQHHKINHFLFAWNKY